MLSGNFGAQLISLLFYPLLVRIFSPESFGIFGVFSSFMVMAGVFASGQLHLGYIKAKDDQELEELIWTFYIYSSLGTLVSTFIVAILNFKFNYFPNFFILFFPLSLISYLWVEGKKMQAIKEEKFKVMSQGMALNRFISNLAKFALGPILATPTSLISSEVLTNSITMFFFNKKLQFKGKKPKHPWAILKKFQHFPLYGTISSFFQFSLMEVPVAFLAISYDPQYIGIYVLVSRLILQPMAFIGNSVGSIASKQLVINFSKGLSSQKSLLQIHLLYMLLAGIIFIGLYCIPQSFYDLILGTKWAGFKNVLIPLSLLVTNRMNSGLHIYFYAATDNLRVKTVCRIIQLTVILALIVNYSDREFVSLLWIISSAEAIMDIIFTAYTILFVARINNQVSA